VTSSQSDPTASDPGPGTEMGARLREVRTARQLSVRELARRAGCSASLISQVERGLTAPSAGVVYAIANELSISLDYLFGKDTAELGVQQQATDAIGGTLASVQDLHDLGSAAGALSTWGRASGPGGEGILLRAPHRSSIDLSSGVRWERLTPQHDRRVDFLEVIYAPHGRSTDTHRAIRHDGREYLMVLDGSLEADIGFETYILAAGDSLVFDPTTPHQYRNVTDQVVRCVSFVVHDPA
jgi:transcriptional regulator with XRE-family HTH domain/quercetin dioxygenase-like cupin family protein